MKTENRISMYNLYKGVYATELEPSEFSVGQNYPNPFKGKTIIKYCVAYKTRVQIIVYDSEGKLIEKLVDEEKKPGTYEVEFNSLTDHSGKSKKLLDGYYFYQMIAGDYSSEKKWLCINNLLRSNKMKTFLQTLFFFLLTIQLCFAQWVQVGLNGEAIKDIAVQNQNIFAVTSDNGKLYRSIDNGVSWTMIVDSCARDVVISQTGKIFMVIKDTLFGIFEWKSLHYSDDNGDTWILSDIMEQISDSLPCIMGGYCPYNISVGPTGIIFCYVAQRGPLAGCGYEDYFGISTNDGLTWNIPTGFSDNRGGALFDFRNQYVITYGMHMAMGEVGNWLSFSSDYGIMWEVIAGPEGASVIGVFSNGNIILSGPWNLPGIQISTDMCSTWTQISTLSCQVGQSYSSGSEEGILVSIDNLGLFLFSDEGDSLGSRNEGLTNLNIQALTLDNNGYVYAGTGNGVWRRPLSEVTSVKDEPTQPSEFILEQNYPNPFNSATEIQYSIPQRSNVTLKIYDILGKEVTTLVNEEKAQGVYTINFDANNLASGMYLYSIQAGSFIETKKMILLK